MQAINNTTPYCQILTRLVLQRFSLLLCLITQELLENTVSFPQSLTKTMDRSWKIPFVGWINIVIFFFLFWSNFSATLRMQIQCIAAAEYYGDRPQ